MRILIVTDQTFPCDEPFLREVYAKRWPDLGEAVFVMQATDQISPGIQVWKGNQVYVLPRDAYSYFKSAKRHGTGKANPLERIYRNEGPFDIVQVRNDLALSLDALRLATRHNMPFVYRLSHLKSETLQLGFQKRLPGYSITDYAKGTIGKRVRSMIVDRADVVFTISESMSSYLVEQGCRTRLEAVPMAADTALDPSSIDPTAFRSEWDLVDKPYLIYIGTMNPIRQLEFLFPVLKRVRDKFDNDIHLVMVGGRSKSNRDRLRMTAHELDIANQVTFTGWVSNETLHQAVVGAKVGLSPIPENYVLRTNSPTKVLEYLNLATPAVATPTPEQKRVLRESEAGALAPRHRSKFADAIKRVLTNECQRQRMGSQGREYIVSNRSYDQTLEEVCDLYARL